ncbi:MAG: hypothetical protein LBH28_06495 [Oscillospiraceae bacterium]|nr:hypothetical protein [Oscillospiraceae bacterium]
MRELSTRKPNRLKGYDYSRNGAYFVTMCVKDRHEIFGQIVGATVPGRPSMEYSELGKFIDETIMYYIKINTDVIFDRYVIMPNHIHMIIIIRSETGDRGRSPLQFIVRNLKSYVTKQAGFSLWQKSFHDHIIRNENEYNKIADYIDNNPMLWKDDCFYPK